MIRENGNASQFNVPGFRSKIGSNFERGASTNRDKLSGFGKNADKGISGVLDMLGLDDAAIALVTGFAADFIFEDGNEWNTEVPHIKSVAGQLVKTVTDFSAMQGGIIEYIQPIFSSYSEIRSTKKRLNYRSFDATQRDIVDALLLACPAYEMIKISEESLSSVLERRYTGNVHVLVSKLIP